MEARDLLQQVTAADRRVFGDDAPSVAYDLDYWGLAERQLGNYPAAVDRHRQALELAVKGYGELHDRTAAARHNLGIALALDGNPEEGIPLLEKALAQRRELHGEEHRFVAMSLHGLGVAHLQGGEHDRALPYLRQAHEIQQATAGDEHPDTAVTLHGLASAHQQQNDLRQAETLYAQALALRQRTLPEHPDQGFVQADLGALLCTSGREAKGEDLLRQSLQFLQGALPAGNWQTAEVATRLGECLVRQDRYAEAEPLLVENHGLIAAARGAGDRRVGASAARIVTLYESWGRPERAAPFRVAE